MLSFSAPTLKIYPDKDSPYGREATYGTAIKLYDYKYLGERSNIIRGRSILSRLDLLLPEIALPIRLYEFRKSEGGKYLRPGQPRDHAERPAAASRQHPERRRRFPDQDPVLAARRAALRYRLRVQAGRVAA